MGERWKDWLAQAHRDLTHARASAEWEWACFAAQQAAEKALKGLVAQLGGAGWGHSVLKLSESLPEAVAAPAAVLAAAVLAAARRLDRLYIQTGYPYGFDAGVPGEYFAKEDAVPDLLEALAGAPLPLDLHPVTVGGLERALEDRDPFVTRALRDAVLLAGTAPSFVKACSRDFAGLDDF